MNKIKLLTLALLLAVSAKAVAADTGVSGLDFSKSQQTAFATLRTQMPVHIFDFKRSYGTTGLFFQNVTFGAGASSTLDTNFSSNTITAGTTPTGYAITQTRTYYEYQPGSGWRLFMSANFMGAVTGTVKRIGIFDANDGLFFEVSGTAASLGVGYRSSTSGSPVTTTITQANWNVDRLDGTGTSKKVLDITKANLFFIEQAWLGVGSVWWGVVIDGKPYYCHVLNNENRNMGVYTKTASLPLRCSIMNWGTGPANPAYMSSIGWSLSAEGPYDNTGRIFSQASQATTGTINSGTLRVLMSLRLRSAWKRGNLKPQVYWNTQSTANINGKLEVWLLQGGAGMGTTQNNLTWTACAVGKSAVEYTADTYTLTTTTAGVICMSSDGSTGSQKGGRGVVGDGYLYAGADYDGVQDVLVLTYTPVDGNGVCPAYGMSWSERY